MRGLFKVTYFDPKRGACNVDATKVVAADAEDAIRKAEKFKTCKYYKVEAVECLGFASA